MTRCVCSPRKCPKLQLKIRKRYQRIAPSVYSMHCSCGRRYIKRMHRRGQFRLQWHFICRYVSHLRLIVVVIVVGSSLAVDHGLGFFKPASGKGLQELDRTLFADLARGLQRCSFALVLDVEFSALGVQEKHHPKSAIHCCNVQRCVPMFILCPCVCTFSYCCLSMSELIIFASAEQSRLRTCRGFSCFSTIIFLLRRCLLTPHYYTKSTTQSSNAANKPVQGAVQSWHGKNPSKMFTRYWYDDH
mmetsp:Transcript_7473/g.16476  ORF Transcript_7473/g.16476 Transcript_7473/m.16476 type:complete len:245 (+) Transcript_7473:214-948(+)